MTLISRDPFARTELHRNTIAPADVSYAHLTCDWCGNRGHDGRLFRYRTEHDGGRVDQHQGYFCSKTCYDTYAQG